jgi:hypothetical protein
VEREERPCAVRIQVVEVVALDAHEVVRCGRPAAISVSWLILQKLLFDKLTPRYQ